MSGEIEFDTGGAPFPDAPAAEAAHGAPAGNSGESAAAPADAEQAMLALEQHQDDADFMRRYLDGDKAALAQMTRLHERAFPGAQAAMGEVAPAAQVAFSDALAAGDARSSDPMDLARQVAFQPSRGPWEFENLLHAGQSADETAVGIEIAQALHDSGIPVATANTLRAIGQRIAQQGGAGNPEAAIAAGTAELERRHGADAGQLIEDASAAFEHLDATHPAIGDALLDAGLASDPDGIEALARWYRAARTMQ